MSPSMTSIRLLVGVLTLFAVLPARSAEVVPFRSDFQPGAIVVRTEERRLYFVLDDARAIRYPVAVGRPGKQWAGSTHISGKHISPAWSPPEEVRRDSPNLPHVIPGGAPNNPMGPRALTLAGGEYAIHGTNRPQSIGTFASYGCIRMYNEHIRDLFERVNVGTAVYVLRADPLPTAAGRLPRPYGSGDRYTGIKTPAAERQARESSGQT